MNTQELSFRDQCALVALDKLCHKIFEKEFILQANDAELEAEELLAAYCWQIADAMTNQRGSK